MRSHEPEVLRELFGERVVVSGIARFRASGRLLRLEGEATNRVGPGDKLFETGPVAVGLGAVAVSEA